MRKTFMIHTFSDGGHDHLELGGMDRVKRVFRSAQLSDGEVLVAGVYHAEGGKLVKGVLTSLSEPCGDGYRTVTLTLSGPDGAAWDRYAYVEDGAA